MLGQFVLKVQVYYPIKEMIINRKYIKYYVGDKKEEDPTWNYEIAYEEYIQRKLKVKPYKYEI